MHVTVYNNKYKKSNGQIQYCLMNESPEASKVRCFACSVLCHLLKLNECFFVRALSFFWEGKVTASQQEVSIVLSQLTAFESDRRFTQASARS